MKDKYSLIGIDGNAYAIMGYTKNAMKCEGFDKSEIDEMLSQAMSSDYDNLLMVCGEYIDKANERVQEAV